MLSIIKKTKNKIVLSLMLSLCFFSCHESQDIKAIIYIEGSVIKEFKGVFYATKYGGLNYYISNENERNEFLKLQNIDSIALNINGNNYICKPIIDKPYSRTINNSDFSFFINEKEHKIIVDTINNMNTILFFSAKTNMEKLKDKKIIKFTLIDK